MSINILVHQIFQLTTIAVFIFFISDFRQKNKMTPLIDVRLIKILKLGYLIPISLYIYTLITLQDLYPVEYLVPVFTILGTYLVAKAKSDLGQFHTWTGYYARANEFVCAGIYSYIRHPLYTGIYLFIIGGLTSITLHAPWFVALIAWISSIYVMVFIAISARRETLLLVTQFGSPYQRYHQQTHPFLPLRRFKPEEMLDE